VSRLQYAEQGVIVEPARRVGVQEFLVFGPQPIAFTGVEAFGRARQQVAL
jgi:hypothetical protein